MQPQEIFKRYEKKYLLEKEQYQRLQEALQDRMEIDQYGKHTICNIYFDTSNYELIRTSIDKPIYKEKLRLRSYGVPKEDDVVFVELKKKFDGIVYKRRVPMKLSEARRYLYQGKYPGKDSQILREVEYVRKHYHLVPEVYLAYERIALFGKENPDLRMTFDMDIRGRETNLDLAAGSYGDPIMKEGQVLMEVKIPEAMPVWMSEIFSELSIYPGSFSKYGEYYIQHILAC